MAKVIYLSPSNHGKGANKCLKEGCYEDKHTRPIAEVIERYLKYNGFTVVIASDDKNMSARAKEADKLGADLYVPIHTNAASPSARYLMFMFWADNATYRKIFNSVAPEVEAVYPDKLKSHFDVRTDLFEINTPKAKTMYLELGFHTNQVDCDKFIHNPETVGKAIAKGICKYYGVTFKEPQPESESASTGKLYYVQTGAFSSKANAEAQVAELAKAGFKAIIKQ